MVNDSQAPAWVWEISNMAMRWAEQIRAEYGDSVGPNGTPLVIAHPGYRMMHTDIPRLVAVAVEMAELIENTRKAFDSWEGEYSDTLVRYPDRCGRVGETCDKCMLDASACERILAKYRGEVQP